MDYPITWQNDILVTPSENKSSEIVICAQKSDKQLVELVLAGEEDAFEQLFERHKRLVAVIANRYFQRPEQIEEIIQISFTKVYLELKNFRGKHDFSFNSWLGRVTTNVCLDAIRSRKRKPENLTCELSAGETAILFADELPANKTAENLFVERDLVEKLLSSLPINDRAILQMLYDEELTVDEIAEATGWSRSKIKMRAYRARGALRKILRKFV